jgi:AcrR family transcriptional regulator
MKKSKKKATSTKADEGQDHDQSVRTRLLDASLRLFAKQGFEAPLRSIAATAGTNLGAIRYYFGSKDSLIRAVFDRFAEPVNSQRLAALNAYENALSSERPDFQMLVRALVEPTVRLGRQPSQPAYHFFQIINLAYALRPAKIMKIMREEYDPIAARFVAAFGRALPHLSEEALLWRYVFMMGAVVHAIVEPEAMKRVEHLSKHHAKVDDANQVIEQLIPFLVHGFMAPQELDKSCSRPKT